jgi:hypothetical protein
MSNIDEEAKDNFTIEMRIFFCRMNARDVFILWLFCVIITIFQKYLIL